MELFKKILLVSLLAVSAQSVSLFAGKPQKEIKDTAERMYTTVTQHAAQIPGHARATGAAINHGAHIASDAIRTVGTKIRQHPAVAAGNAFALATAALSFVTVDSVMCDAACQYGVVMAPLYGATIIATVTNSVGAVIGYVTSKINEPTPADTLKEIVRKGLNEQATERMANDPELMQRAAELEAAKVAYSESLNQAKIG